MNFDKYLILKLGIIFLGIILLIFIIFNFKNEMNTNKNGEYLGSFCLNKICVDDFCFTNFTEPQDVKVYLVKEEFNIDKIYVIKFVPTGISCGNNQKSYIEGE